MVMLAVLL
jgi:hypothetical protein